MKMMFNGLDQPFELSNSKYEREAWEVLWFAKYHSLTIYIYIYIYQLILKFSNVLCFCVYFVCLCGRQRWEILGRHYQDYLERCSCLGADPQTSCQREGKIGFSSQKRDKTNIFSIFFIKIYIFIRVFVHKKNSRGSYL
jgi:hypothetical protein